MLSHDERPPAPPIGRPALRQGEIAEVGSIIDQGRSPAGDSFRLLWLIDSLTMGGAEALAGSFAEGARSRGIDLTVCARTTIEGNPLEEEIRSTGVRVENLRARHLRDLGALRRLSALVRELQPDLIHAHLTYAAIWGSVVARWHRIPLVVSLHVPPSTGAGAGEAIRQRLMVALVNRWAARVITVSRALRDEWRKRSALDASKMTVIHNGIAVDERSDPRGSQRRAALLNRESGTFTVVTVAVLREGKGIDVLLRAARRILDEQPDLRFVIVGDGPMRESWASLAADLQIDWAVRWAGFRRDVAAILTAADLFVLPTLADAFPTVLLEAFAAGVPVIASDVGGVPEIVEDPWTGLTVPPGDPQALGEAILRARRDDSWRLSAATAARSLVEQRFSIEQWLEHLQTLYRDVIDERQRSAKDGR